MLKAYEDVVQKATQQAELPGFRRGKAPRNLIEPKLDRSETFSRALQDILPGAYQAAVKQHGLRLILYPKLQVTQAREAQDWMVTAISCETPPVVLPDYRKDLPGSVKDLPDILDYLLKNTRVDLPSVLVEEETNRRLAILAENLTGLGMTIQSYLAQKKLTPESLKNQFAQQAKNELTLEFSLASIQSGEKLENRQKTLDFLTTLL